MSRKEQLIKLIEDAIAELNAMDKNKKYRLQVLDAMLKNVEQSVTYYEPGHLKAKLIKVKKANIQELKKLYDEQDDLTFREVLDAVEEVRVAVEIFWTNRRGDINANGLIVLALLDQIEVHCRELPSSSKHELAIWLRSYRLYKVKEFIEGLQAWVALGKQYYVKENENENEEK